MKKIIFSKYSNERSKKFSIRTDIIKENKDKLYVQKTAMSKESENHLDNIYKNYSILSKIYKNSKLTICNCSKKENSLEFEFIKGQTLAEKLDEYMQQKNYIAIIDLIKEYATIIKSNLVEETFYVTDEFINIFGNVTLPEPLIAYNFNNIDLIFSNIIIINDIWTAIDYEWTFDFLIPFNYILYRAIHFYLYDTTKRTVLHNLELYKIVGISDNEIELYDKMEDNFQKYILGEITPISKLYTKTTKNNIDINKVITDSRNNNLQVYLDYGNGFNEKDTYYIQNINGNRIMEFQLQITSDVKNIRIDPTNTNCLVKIIKLYSEETNDYPCYYTNGVDFSEDIILFLGNDPQIVINGIAGSIHTLNVVIEIIIISEATAQQMKKITNEKDDLVQKFELISFENRKVKEQLNKETIRLNRIIDEVNQNNLELSHNNNLNLKQIEQLYKNISDRDETINDLLIVNNNLQKQYNDINNSSCWKLTKPIRLVLLKINKIFNNKVEDINTKEIYADDLVTTHYNIENFTYNNNQLQIKGWIYNDNTLIEEIFVNIKGKNGIKNIKLVYGLERMDVNSAYGNKNSLYSGFILDCNIINFKSLEISLEYTLEHQTKSISIGKINNSFFDIIKYYMKKMNPELIRRLFMYIRKGMLLSVLKAHNNPLISFSSQQISNTELVKFIKENVIEGNEYPTKLFEEMIDIIIPVYNGFEYFDPLFSSLSITKIKYRLLIVNDKSTDQRVYSYLNNLQKGNDNIILINNEENLGFVKSVNKALEISKNHVVLLNTDVEVPNMWLERLMYPIIMNHDIATTTPFTNCGTICGFPNFGDNSLFEDISLESIDKQFQIIKPKYTNIPTGVGFCMGMNKKAIEKIGYLDDKTFSKGYCEENDWCQRAIKAGFKNVHVENLFVYHKHGGSFLSKEKAELIEKNNKLLLKKHSNYNIDVANYCDIDPVKDVRNFVAMKLTLLKAKNGVILAFDHSLGGGATSYLDNKRKKELAEGNVFIIIRYDYQLKLYLFNYSYGNYVYNYYFTKFKDILKIINQINIDVIYINEFVSYPNLYEVHDTLINIKEQYNIKVIMLLHDYFSICPATNLLNNNGVFCDIPDIKLCEKCLKDNIYNYYAEYISIEKWRNSWYNILISCNEIIAFSKSSIDLLEKAYGKLPNYTIIPHQVNFLPKLEKNYKITKTLNIGLLGILNDQKGYKLIKDMVNIISKSKLNIRIILIGESAGDELKNESYYETGRYTVGMLPNLIVKNDIDIFFISSIWPETFSYTTEEVMKMNMPIAVLNLGAPVERVNNYNKGLIIDKIDPEYIIDKIQEFSRKIIEGLQSPYGTEKVLFVAEYISFSSRYRVEHMMEQLLFQGIRSDFIEINKIKDVDLIQYKTVVIYRCRKNPILEEFISNIHKQGMKIFYDIDDFIFDYNSIKNLDFLKGDEYKNFDTYTNEINECMSICDGFLTSTMNMKNAIEKSFVNKPVCVNRNVASSEMVVLSLKAKENIKVVDDSKITLGYFSGSKTHDSDFNLITDVLLEIMENNQNVFLKTGGCIELDHRFDKYKKQLLHFDFVDWRQLPELISTIDINLMPLENTFFNSCKSENKWMEAGLLGIPTVASKNDELEICIENGMTGFLCSNSQEWKATLEKLIENKKLRTAIGQAAHDKVLKNKVSYHTGIEAVKFIFQK